MKEVTEQTGLVERLKNYLMPSQGRKQKSDPLSSPMNSKETLKHSEDLNKQLKKDAKRSKGKLDGYKKTPSKDASS